MSGETRGVHAVAGGAGEGGVDGGRRTRVARRAGGIPGRRVAHVVDDLRGRHEEPDEPGAGRGGIRVVEVSPVALEDEARDRRSSPVVSRKQPGCMMAKAEVLAARMETEAFMPVPGFTPPHWLAWTTTFDPKRLEVS